MQTDICRGDEYIKQAENTSNNVSLFGRLLGNSTTLELYGQAIFWYQKGYAWDKVYATHQKIAEIKRNIDICKGDVFVSQAVNTLNNFAFIGILFRDLNKDALELYKKAVLWYKKAQAWDKAYHTYKIIGELATKLGNKYEETNAFDNVYKCSLKLNINKQIKSIKQCMEHVDSNNSDQSLVEGNNSNQSLVNDITMAYYNMTLGQIFESEKKYVDAKIYYDKALHYYDLHAEIDLGNNCLLKIAVCVVKTCNYKEGAIIFELLADRSKHDKLFANNITDYLVNAALCHMCTSSVVPFDKYTTHYGFLEWTNSTSSLVKLMDTLESKNINELTQHVNEWNNNEKFDYLRKELLLKIKENIKY
jgi:alpha-soluble NSF attachment protein